MGLMEPITRWSGFSRFTFPVEPGTQNITCDVRHRHTRAHNGIYTQLDVACVPVQCFFKLLVGIGWTATRYLGSASNRKMYTIKYN